MSLLCANNIIIFIIYGKIYSEFSSLFKINSYELTLKP